MTPPVFLTLLLASLALLAASLPSPPSSLRPANRSHTATAPDPFSHPSLVTEFDLQILPAHLESLRLHPRNPVPVHVRAPGIDLASVAVRVKGSSGSFRPIDDRPSFTLDFQRFAAGPNPVTFHGRSKIHLNNSVEDPGLLHAIAGAHLFESAGLPAQQVTFARVRLNGRLLGLYHLIEGFSVDFIDRHLDRQPGALFEPEPGTDLDGSWDLKATKPASLPPSTSGSIPSATSAPLLSPTAHLVHAARLPEASARWTALAAALDPDGFLLGLALQVAAGHHDGYAMARNNFRVFRSADSGRLTYLPQGLDQLFGRPDLPAFPAMGGTLAQAALDCPQSRARYRHHLLDLIRTNGPLDSLADWIPNRVRLAIPHLTRSESRHLRQAAQDLRQRVLARVHHLRHQLAVPDPVPLQLAVGSEFSPTTWRPVDAPSALRMIESTGPDGRSGFEIEANRATFASWRCSLHLATGRYRFETQARVDGVEPLATGQHHGARIRISGRPCSAPGLLGSEAGHLLQQEFEISDPVAQVDLICELRASRGVAGFQSPKLSRLTDRSQP